MARNAIESEFRTSEMADQSEMTKNVIESDFRTSKMADGGHFVNLKKKVPYRYEMARNAIESEYSDIKNGRRRPFCQKYILKIVVSI